MKISPSEILAESEIHLVCRRCKRTLRLIVATELVGYDELDHEKALACEAHNCMEGYSSNGIDGQAQRSPG